MKKKTVKKISHLLLVFALISSLFGSIASAESSISEVDQYLLNAGYPQELINIFEPDQKLDLYNNEAVYVTHEVNYDTLQEESVVTPMKLSNFSHVITISQVKAPLSGLVQFAVNYNWDWNYAPIFTGEDQFGLGWTDDFNLVNNSSKYSYKAFGYRHDTSGTHYAESGGVTQNGHFKAPPAAGVTYKVNLIKEFTSGGKVYIVNRHKGWAGFQIYREHNKSGNIDSTAMEGKYFHKEWRLDGEITISNPPSVGFSISSGVDESDAAAKSWNWYHKDF